MKSSPHIHKSQLWHTHVWCIFCQQWCFFRALALLCTTHGHTSVLNFQFSSFLLYFCCGTSAVWHLLIFVTQHNTCPNSPAMTSSTELFFLMSCLVTLHAFQCSYRYKPFDRYIHSSSVSFMLQTLYSSKSFSDLHAQLASDWTQSGWVFFVGIIRGRYPSARGYFCSLSNS